MSDWSSGYVSALTQLAAWNPPYGKYALWGIFILVAFVIGWALWRLNVSQETRNDPKALTPVRRDGYKPKHIPVVPFVLGKVTVDLMPGLKDILHVLIGGTSRLGKSTAVSGLYDLDIGILTIALDDSDPIREKVRSIPDGVEWLSSPDSPTGINLLTGDPLVCSEVLVGGFGLVGQGAWQRKARMRILTALEKLDWQGKPRTMADICGALAATIPGEAAANTACRDWADRLMWMQRVLGPALGPGLDLVTAMRQRKKVLLRMNRFLSPMDAPMLGGMLLVHARVVAAEAGVPFLLVIEEAGQMNQYADEIKPLTQAAGARGVSVIVITQNPSKLPEEVTGNCSVRVSFGHESAQEMKFAADSLHLKPDQLHRMNMPNEGRGWCYVQAPGMETRLVQVKKPKVSSSAKKVSIPGFSVSYRKRMPELDGWVKPKPVLSLPDPHSRKPWWINNPDRERAWGYLRRAKAPSLLWHPDRGFWEGESCLEWHGSKAGGRPLFKIDGGTETVYRLTFVWSGKELAEALQLDHWCANPLCCDPEHLEPVTARENNRRRSARKAALKAYLANTGAMAV